jgi:hypothetical protein
MAKIFVNICSYRDPLVGQTLTNLLETESKLNKVTYGILEQTRLEDSLEHNCPELAKHPQVKYKRVEPGASDGIGWARLVNSLQVTDEEFFYQIDSHAIFDEGWDFFVLSDYRLAERKAKTNRIIITSCCKTCDVDDEGMMYKITKERMGCKVLYYGFQNGVPSPAGTSVSVNEDVTPAIHVNGGNLFTHIDFLKNVGLNGNLYFNAEEQYITISAYANGYKLFHPREIYCYHYDFSASNPYWTKDWYEPVITDEKRDSLFEKGLKEYHDYIEKTDYKILQDYRKYSGVDLINKKLERRAIIQGLSLNPKDFPDTWTIEDRND